MSKPLRLGGFLALLNAAAWCLLFALRTPYTSEQCAALDQRCVRATTDPIGVIITDQPHLLFGRPIRSSWGEPPPSLALILLNIVPLSLSWHLVAGDLSYYPGPTCSQSFRAGFYFLLFATLQWLVIGAGLALMSRVRRRLIARARRQGPA